MCDVIRLDIIRDEWVRECLDVAKIVGKNEREPIETIWTC